MIRRISKLLFALTMVLALSCSVFANLKDKAEQDEQSEKFKSQGEKFITSCTGAKIEAKIDWDSFKNKTSGRMNWEIVDKCSDVLQGMNAVCEKFKKAGIDMVKKISQVNCVAQGVDEKLPKITKSGSKITYSPAIQFSNGREETIKYFETLE